MDRFFICFYFPKRTCTTLPKPPLAKKAKESGLMTIDENRPMTSEALLKMADEGISELQD